MTTQKIAIPTCEGKLWPHFGKAPQLTIVTVEDGQVQETVTLDAPEHEHGAMPRFIAANDCTDIICGGLGPGAVNMIAQLGINLHAGAPELPVEELLKQYHDGCGGHHHDHEC